jgi:hypothetical protein
VLYAAPHLQHQRDKTAASPRRLLVLQQRLWCPTLALVAPPTSSATAARDLAICNEIALANGRSLLLLTVGIFSASDIEDENIIAANILGCDDGAEEVLGTSATNNYMTLIVHRALSTTVGEDDKRQRHNLFNMFLVVKDCRVHTIIDGGSYNNLFTREHPHPYHIQWFNNNGKVKVTKIARIHFSIGSYHDFADFDVVPWMLALFCWDILGSLILMLFTMIDLISILSCIRVRKLCCCQ